MKKVVILVFTGLFLFVGGSLTEAQEVTEGNLLQEPQTFESSITPFMDGEVYKYVSHKESNKKTTYLGKVTKSPSVSFGVATKNGYINDSVKYFV